MQVLSSERLKTKWQKYGGAQASPSLLYSLKIPTKLNEEEKQHENNDPLRL